MKKNTVVEFTAVAQKDSSLSRGKIGGPSIQISLSITHKDVFGNKVKPEVKILNRQVVLMRASCHFNRSSNVEIGFECRKFIIVIFFNREQVLHWGTFKIPYVPPILGQLSDLISLAKICLTA